MNMFELSIEKVVFSHSVEVQVKSGLGSIKIRARYIQNDDYVCITESKHRVNPIYISINTTDLDLNEQENLKNFLFEWIISEEGTNFMRIVFDSKPPKIER